MSIRVYIPDFGYLRHVTENTDEVEVEGRTVGECLSHVIRNFPGIEKHLLAKDGKLLTHFDIWVNGKSAYPEMLAKSVQDGDKLDILISGA